LGVAAPPDARERAHLAQVTVRPYQCSRAETTRRNLLINYPL